MENRPVDPGFIDCPHCQAQNDRRAARCGHCGESLVIVNENPYAAPGSTDRLAGAPGTFHIGSLMLLIALVAFCLALLVTTPGVGVLAILGLTPASIRTALGVLRRKRQHAPLQWPETVALFFGSLGVVLVIEFGVVTSFVATCLPIGLISFGGNSPIGIFIAVGVGLTAAGFAGYHLIRRFWPWRDLYAAPRPHIPGDDGEPLS